MAGERISACEHCYRMEDAGSISMRQLANRGSTEMFVGQAREMVDDRAAEAGPPSSLHLWLGNLCNMKCRMCSPIYSSQIAADAEHAKWVAPLRTEAHLLPTYLPGAVYSGFGELRGAGSDLLREVAVGRDASIVLAGNGDPISSIEVIGCKGGPDPVTLTVAADGQTLASSILVEPEWQLKVQPNPPRPGGKPLVLSLYFEGPRQALGIRRLRLTCNAPLRKAYPQELVSRFSGDLPWAQNRDLLMGELFAHPERLGHLDFAGGEPMLNPHLQSILEMLVESGHASHISASFSTNATVHVPRIIELLREFRHVDLWFSLDGTEALQEYIRPPARWESVWRNVLRYAQEPFNLAIHTTPQAYNLFGLLDLVRLCDEHGLSFALNNVLYEPRWLSFDMLPQSIVDEGLREWESYLAAECREDQVPEVETLLAHLRRPRADAIDELQELFVRFTNDLDRSRRQSLEAAEPRLYRRLKEHGLELAGRTSAK